MRKINLAILLFLLSFTSGVAQQFERASFTINGNTLPYRIMFPENYDETKKYPLLLFLHGAGERGSDNEKQLIHGKDFMTGNAYSKYPAIIIAPQCPEGSYWGCTKRHQIGNEIKFSFIASTTPTQPMSLLMDLIQDWLDSGKIDKSRVYVGGLSMGGMGTFELLWRMPDTFAAAFPICGGGLPEKAALYAKNTAVWIFHGDSDSVVPVQYSRTMHNALRREECDVILTEYPNVDHNSWDYAFKEKDLFPWLFSHKLNK